MTFVVMFHLYIAIFQLTSSRGGWLLCCDIPSVYSNISTHILTRRMTTANQTAGSAEAISTHILTRRMTISVYANGIDEVFQLTSSRGGWRAASPASWHNICISTHILTRRMTIRFNAFFNIISFQLTSSRGGWHLISWVVCSSDIFQLTSSRGGWPPSNPISVS